MRVGESLAPNLALPARRSGPQLRAAVQHRATRLSSQRGRTQAGLGLSPALGHAWLQLSSVQVQLESARATRLELSQQLGALRIVPGGAPATERTSLGLRVWVGAVAALPTELPAKPTPPTGP